MQISATVIADSCNKFNGVRVTSIELCFPRFILPQLLMHRNFSRSLESLRARPTASKLQEPGYTPDAFRVNAKGMVPAGYLNGEQQSQAGDAWRGAMQAARDYAAILATYGVAKQWANRLLEPFAWQRGLFTATVGTWMQYLRLRDADDVQDEHHELAECIRTAIATSTPWEVDAGQWHLPYMPGGWGYHFERDVSAARCARVSYNAHDGVNTQRDLDLALAAKLFKARHSNPFEHQLTPLTDNGRCANFAGWKTYRSELAI